MLVLITSGFIWLLCLWSDSARNPPKFVAYTYIRFYSTFCQVFFFRLGGIDHDKCMSGHLIYNNM